MRKLISVTPPSRNPRLRRLEPRISPLRHARSRDVLAALVGGLLTALGVLLAQTLAGLSEEKNRSVLYLEYATKLLALPVKEDSKIREFAVNIIQERSPPGTFSDQTRAEFLALQIPASVALAQPSGVTEISRYYYTSPPPQEPASSRDTARNGNASPSPTSASPQLARLGIVTMPDDIQDMWVFYQSRADQTPNGCRRPPNADPLNPSTFPSRLDEFVAEARRNPDIDLIITAKSPSKSWGAVNDIRIEGLRIEDTVPYFCNGYRSLGSRVRI